MSRLLTHKEVAERLSVTLDFFYRHRARLCAEEGFPPHVAGIRNRYDPAAIDAWLARQRPDATAATISGPAPEALLASLDGWQAELDRRAEILGRRA